MEGIEKYRSSEEAYMSWWLDDAVRCGFVKSFEYEPPAFVLSEALHVLTKKVRLLKKGEKTEIDAKSILQIQTYTCDFRIVWTDAGAFAFTKRIDRIIDDDTPYFYAMEEDGELVSYIDVKPGFRNTAQASSVRFSVKQAWLWQVHKKFVQKVIVVQSIKAKLTRRYSGLFVETYVPSRYLLSDKAEQKRKINFNYKLAEDYV